MTQSERLLDHLKNGKSITRLQALVDLGIFELSARIIELEKLGYSINKTRIQITNRFGEACRVTRYSME